MSKILTTTRDGFKISFKNEEEFERIYEDVFKRNEYPFTSNKKSPFILDCGVHIGLSIIYFKKLYPEARIIAFDPNPRTFELLKLNISQNGIENVELKNVAISDKNGEETFYLENKDDNLPTWGDSLEQNKWYDFKKGTTVKVKTVKLSDLIEKETDLIKLDIEGSEEKVIREIESKMDFVKNIFMEYHGSLSNPNNDELRILDILKKNNYKTRINQEWRFIQEDQIKRSNPYWLSIYAEK